MSFEKRTDEASACPNCGHFSFYVIESRPNKDGKRRRRSCSKCKHRETTYEINETIYKELKLAKAQIEKIYKTLLINSEISVAPVSKEESIILCKTCSLNSGGKCDLDLPEYDTEEASDCNYHKEP